jgi:hypothetical protein
MESKKKPNRTDLMMWVIRLYFLVATFQGFLVFYRILRIPVEPGAAVFFGFSPERFLILLGVVIATLAFIWLTLKSILDVSWTHNKASKLETWLNLNKNFGAILLLLVILVIGGTYFILQGHDVTEPFALAYFIRLQPISYWIVAMSIQSLIVVSLIHSRTDLSKFSDRNKIFLTAFLVFGFFMLVWVWISWTRIGLKSETVGWNYLGPPVVEIQVLIAWVLGLVFIILSPSLDNLLRKLGLTDFPIDPYIKFDVLVSILIWLAALILWNSIPLTSSWFVSPPRPPNFEFYPNSDAILYDTTAQSVLVGEGFKSWGTAYASRPMYALFLSILHSVGGLNYEPIIFMQVAVLAIFPVLLYWIARILHNRLSGIIIASLIILREANAILLNNVITVSNSKLIMADLPTAVGVALFCLISLAWLQKPKQRKYLPLVAGGILGISMLIRPEVGSLLLPIGIIIFASFYRQPMQLLGSSVLLVIGILLVLSPWIWRNWQIDKKIFIDQPNYRADLFAKRYSEDPEETIIRIKPGETYEEHSERMTESALDFAQDQPRSIVNFILSHYMNSQIQMVLILPTSFRLIDSGIEFIGHKELPQFWEDCCSIIGYIRRLPFWFKWDGILPHQSIIPVVLNIFLLAFGISVSWHNYRLIGLLPAAIMVTHLLINAVVRNSGGRYILPVDWVSFLYFSIGLAHITLWGFKYFTNKEPSRLVTVEISTDTKTLEERSTPIAKSPQMKTILIVAIGLLLVGFSLPFTERVISARYQNQLMPSQVISIIEQDAKNIDTYDLESIKSILADNSVILQGRALYPRFHAANVGEPGEWRSFQPRPYSRVSFYLVGPQNHGVILPYNSAPDYFLHGSDVVVIGCYNDRYFDALGIITLDPADQSVDEVLVRTPLDGLTCPLPSLE